MRQDNQTAAAEDTVDHDAHADLLDDLMARVAPCFVHARLVIEPAAATALAGALSRGAEFGADAGVLLSGGNVDTGLVASLLSDRVNEMR